MNRCNSTTSILAVTGGATKLVHFNIPKCRKASSMADRFSGGMAARVILGSRS
jgi:hypothetical protein